MFRPFVETMVDLDVVDSTNDEAIRRLRAGDVALPMLVRAARQTAGRGRGENRWWSGEGSLTFTVALDPGSAALRVEQQPRVALATAVAVIDALFALVPHVAAGIRWPNDVEVGERKLGGILPEHVASPSGDRLVIGVGLNVRSNLADAPADVRGLGVSLSSLGADVDPDTLLGEILTRLGPALGALASGDPRLVQRWRDLDVLAGRTVRVAREHDIVTGLARGIDEHGALEVATDAGVVTLFGGRVLRVPSIDLLG